MAITENLIIGLGGILVFKGSTYIPAVENFMKTQPYLIILVGFVFFLFGRKIAKTLGIKVED